MHGCITSDTHTFTQTYKLSHITSSVSFILMKNQTHIHQIEQSCRLTEEKNALGYKEIFIEPKFINKLIASSLVAHCGSLGLIGGHWSSFWVIGGSLGVIGGDWGSFGGHWGSLGAHWGSLGDHWGSFWVIGGSLGVIGGSLEVIGGHWRSLDVIGGHWR